MIDEKQKTDGNHIDRRYVIRICRSRLCGLLAVRFCGLVVANDVVQTQRANGQATNAQPTANETQNTVYADDYSGTYAVPYFEMDGGKTYHEVTITYDAGSQSILYHDPVSGYTAIYTYFGAGLNGGCL